MLTISILLALVQAKTETEEPTYRVHLRNGHAVDGVLLYADKKAKGLVLRTSLGGNVTIRFAEMAVVSKECKPEYGCAETPPSAKSKTCPNAGDCCHGIPVGQLRHHGIRPRTKGEKAVQTEVKPEDTKTDTTKTDTTKPDTTTGPKDTTKTDTSRTGTVDTTKTTSDVEPINPSNPPLTSAEVKKRVDDQLRRIRDARGEEKDRLANEMPALGDRADEYLADLVDRVEEELSGYIVGSLQGRKDDRVVSILKDKMKSKADRIRLSVLNLLNGLIDDDDIASLRPYLRDVSPEVRIAALTAVEKHGDEDSLETIAAMTADSDPNVGRAAGVSLEKLAKKFDRIDDAIDILKDVVGQASGASRAEVIDALGKMNSKDVIETVLEYLDDGESSVRANVARVCGELKAVDSIEPLIDLLGREDVKWVKTQICNAFDKIKDKRTIEPLIDLMEREDDDDLDEAAARALQHITGLKDKGHDHDKWREWYEKIKGRSEDNDN